MLLLLIIEILIYHTQKILDVDDILEVMGDPTSPKQIIARMDLEVFYLYVFVEVSKCVLTFFFFFF